MKPTQKEKQARERVCLALDVHTLEEGLGLTKELSDYVGSVKINSLYNSAINQEKNAVKEINQRGSETFLDLKYHNTPNTVFNYGYASAIPGVYMFNIHVAGGEETCKKAMEGAYKGAQERGIKRPKVIGITVLTSLDDTDLEEQRINVKYDDLVRKRTELAKK